MNTNTDNVWRRSTYCDTGACIEVREAGDRIWIRDTGSGWYVASSRADFLAFIAGARAGEFDDLAASDG